MTKGLIRGGSIYLLLTQRELWEVFGDKDRKDPTKMQVDRTITNGNDGEKQLVIVISRKKTEEEGA